MKSNYIAYPLLFKPIFKERIWGGQTLKKLNKKICSQTTGESWELSAIPEDESIVESGIYKNKSITDLLSSFSVEILGQSVVDKFGTLFPLLFKYLDAQQDLSIQVHPNDELAMKRHGSLGKTEMWYVVEADDNATILVGFKEKVTKQQYLSAIENNNIEKLLNKIPVKKGDVFMLETGTVHAIGAGTLIAEIQQSSDITYRIYDFDRRDVHGNLRELHNDLAVDAINFEKTDCRRDYQKTENSLNNIVTSQYFTTNYIALNGRLAMSKNNDNFAVYMVVDGSCKINYEGEINYFEKGQTILIPAILTNFEFVGQATILEITI
ncbi:MAG: hypothetical protein RLZZ312_1401 [Bacteroidota bacterium]|jgi:mannose-6-phosphate isomerase